MINKGDLFQGVASIKGHGHPFIEIIRTYNKRDIDPDCPESVAIVGMVEAVMLSGPDIGKTKSYHRRGFNQLFLRVEEV